MAVAETNGHTSAASQEAWARRTEHYAESIVELANWEGKLIEVEEGLQFLKERIWYHRERVRSQRAGM